MSTKLLEIYDKDSQQTMTYNVNSSPCKCSSNVSYFLNWPLQKAPTFAPKGNEIQASSGEPQIPSSFQRKYIPPTMSSSSELTPRSHAFLIKKWPAEFVLSELGLQGRIILPLIAMNLSCFSKIAITTAFLGRLGELQLAGAALGFTFANFTGFSVLNGLCAAMEPICGQAYGAKNYRLLHKTLLMTTFLLLITTLPITFLWLNVDKILVRFGQQEDIAVVAGRYLLNLLPDLAVTSFLCPLKAYLSSQGLTIPIMFSSVLALALHVPLNILLSEARGLEGVSMAIWISDLFVVMLLSVYVLVAENMEGGKWMEGGWWDQKFTDWATLLRLCGPCCLTTCLEWWCYEILVLLTGRLPNAKRTLGALAIVLNFDYLLYSVMLSLAVCASTRVSNELGASQSRAASRSASVSLSVGVVSGFGGGLVTVAARYIWGSLFSHDRSTIRMVKRMMLLIALLEVINFPLVVCGGIIRGTARPWLGICANVGGFYLLALPLGVVLAFKVALGLEGLLVGFLIGVVMCLILLLVFVMRIDWVEEAAKAQKLTCCQHEEERNCKA